MKKENFEYLKKLALATGYLSQVIENNEHFKDYLQEVSLKIVSLSQRLFNDQNKQGVLAEIKINLSTLLDSIDLALVQGSVSMMNAEYFTQSIRKFIVHLDTQIEQNSTDILIRSLSDSLPAESLQLKLRSKDKFFKSRYEKTLIGLDTDVEIATENAAVELSESSQIVDTKKVQSGLDIRKDKIVEVLKSGAASLKDIRSHFPDVTDKTIQRDLVELIRSKKIIRLGEKRWAKYYLK
jgi:hypothetical protein